MPRESINRTENDINTAFDKKKAVLDVIRFNRTKEQDAAKPVEIEKRLARAKTLLSNSLHARLKNISKASFSMNFDSMAATLDLSLLPKDILQEEMDKIMNIPGIIKTETGYVSNPVILFENFGPGAIRNRVFKIFSNNRDKVFTSKEIAEEVGLSKSAIFAHIHKLVNEGKVKIVGTKNDAHGSHSMNTFAFVEQK